eukprot:750130-Hanusia_phi.AAC.1
MASEHASLDSNNEPTGQFDHQPIAQEELVKNLGCFDQSEAFLPYQVCCLRTRLSSSVTQNQGFKKNPPPHIRVIVLDRMIL